MEDGQTSTDQQPADTPQTASDDETGSGHAPPEAETGTDRISPDLILRITVICLGVVIVLIALLRLTRTNPFVAIFALFIGAMLAVLGLFYARVTNLGGSHTPRVRRPPPSSVTAQDVAGRVVESPKFLRMVVTQLLLTHTAIKQIVMDQPPEVKAQIYEALKEEIRENPG